MGSAQGQRHCIQSLWLDLPVTTGHYSVTSALLLNVAWKPGDIQGPQLPHEVGTAWKVHDGGEWTKQTVRVLHGEEAVAAITEVMHVCVCVCTYVYAYTYACVRLCVRTCVCAC